MGSVRGLIVYVRLKRTRAVPTKSPFGDVHGQLLQVVSQIKIIIFAVGIAHQSRVQMPVHETTLCIYYLLVSVRSQLRLMYL